MGWAAAALTLLLAAGAPFVIGATNDTYAPRYQASGSPCQLPFEFKGALHNECLDWEDGQAWCPDAQGYWGICADGGNQPSRRRLLQSSGSGSTPEGQLLSDFVSRAGTHFVVQGDSSDSCQLFIFGGANSMFLMHHAAREHTRVRIVEILDSAKTLGLKVIRTWAFTEGALQWKSLQRNPGEYDEETWAGLDFALHQASLRGIRLILTFMNNWNHWGGIDTYNAWSFAAGKGSCDGRVECRSEFYSDSTAMGFYWDHIKTVVNRVNTYNGRVYKEDPTIFSYNLGNEPRSTNELYVVQRTTTDTGREYNISYNPANDMQKFVEDTVAYVKQLDPLHLLTIGQEGFFGNSSVMYLYANPGAWSSLEGNDFVRNHLVAGIDYATAHVYVDQWLCTAQGATAEGRQAFMQNWLDAHQQAADEDLQMPVVLEEFGSEMEDRAAQFRLAFDNVVSSAQRGGPLAGAMFWDLVHHEYKPIDIYLDGIMRFGGGYSNWLPAESSDMSELKSIVQGFTSQAEDISAGSKSPDTCVWSPQPKMGLGCSNVNFELQLGGMPWTCLPGEPPNINWCNNRGKDAYVRPPSEWKGSEEGDELPWNTIEALVLGKITNTGSESVNLKGSWVIVPYSMGVHTEFEGVWDQIENPNDYFKVFCWNMELEGKRLCESGAVDVSFTEFFYPEGTKLDRGLNISFTSDVYLSPGSEISAHGGEDRVMISFKDAHDEVEPFRLDVSSMTLAGAHSCPNDPVLQSWPPPPPPAPRPCSEGPHPYRGCPRREWYYNGNTQAVSSAFEEGTAPEQEWQYAPWYNFVALDPPHKGDASGWPTGVAKSTDITSSTSPTSAGSVGLKAGQQMVVWGNIAVSGSIRTAEDVNPSEAQGRSYADTPHPDAIGGAARPGVDAYLVLKYTREGISGPIYQTLARARVQPDGTSVPVRGVIDLQSAGVSDMQLYAEVPFPGLSVRLDGLSAALPAQAVDMAGGGKDNPVVDTYQPCVLPVDRAPDGIFLVELPGGESDTLDIVMCSPGGQDQVLRVYNSDGSVVAETVSPGATPTVWGLRGLQVGSGQRLVVVVDGDMGLPYGSYRGLPGLRMTWRSGRPFDGLYYPTDAGNTTGFVRVSDNNMLMDDCKRAAYVGVNAYDLMDKARFEGNRGEVLNRLDEMVKQDWMVGRTWGFSLGSSGTAIRPEGEVIVDLESTLQPGPDEYNQDVWDALDFVIDEARKRGLKLIIPIENYWVSVQRFTKWSDTASTLNDFYTDFQARQMYKEHVRTFLYHVNSYNGRVYREDPTIFAWELINEARCTGCGYALQSWLEEMTVYFKSLDPNHLLAVGTEGFYSTTCDRVYLNPGAGERREGIASSPWAAQEGQDFLANSMLPEIDIATVHIWPDNWLGYADYCAGEDYLYRNPNFDYTHGCDLWKEKLDYTERWLKAHMEDIKRLNKPMVVDEFGKAVDSPKLEEIIAMADTEDQASLRPGESVESGYHLRNQFMQEVYKQVESSALSDGLVQGTNVWNLYSVGVGEDDPYQITIAHDSTMSVMKQHADNMSPILGTSGSCPEDSADVAG